MGFFDYVFGTHATYSADMKSVSREHIRLLVSQSRVRTLDSEEEYVVEDALDGARQDGKISLRKIDMILRSLVSKQIISVNDKKGVLTQFEHYFESK
ncbi:MAG: hypothetical protein COU32_03930 [Candidatus Magasanikbacteria bacterium CG10_big_fil_rev_8_21_14_0_10_42_10]|uniref:Uncharacterized protein n=2 Tax=Candidatus Magasanikiibacteriota TaxID=1752731 RepID=A0A2H0TX22_9BACT|nr:MAG: hypothetical protein COU32_03930 [Candidatus Magasanikbacteria bacterium CG10_big_fil_rev_8_21_14_0_10_42_10]PIZ94286.1 MAG: hypothetical protein COX82_00875 [Candidatus Magasanikbacteria bacterium CG_4_10_14_0_2_um_filter_41_10]